MRRGSRRIVCQCQRARTAACLPCTDMPSTDSRTSPGCTCSPKWLSQHVRALYIAVLSQHGHNTFPLLSAGPPGTRRTTAIAPSAFGCMTMPMPPCFAAEGLNLSSFLCQIGDARASSKCESRREARLSSAEAGIQFLDPPPDIVSGRSLYLSRGPCPLTSRSRTQQFKSHARRGLGHR